MKLIDPSYKLCEEILDTLIHFTKKSESVEETTIYKAINKTLPYVKKAIDYLIQINVIIRNNHKLSLSEEFRGNLVPISIIKKGVTNFEPFREYLKIIQSGKTEKTSIKLVKTTYNIENDFKKILEIFNKKLQFLDTDIPVIPIIKNKVTDIPKEDNFFWIDENGHLIYDEKAHTEQLIETLEKKRYKNPAFIDQIRIDTLKKINHPDFDLSKLIKICEEINDNYRVENYFSVGVLTRTVLDHVPPIFAKKSFTEFANNYSGKSFKDLMTYLENVTRKIADGILHSHIRNKESLPNATTVDCRNGLDVLLGEIISKIK